MSEVNNLKAVGKRTMFAAVMLGSLASCSDGGQVAESKAKPTTTTVTDREARPILGCAPFEIFAQNRFAVDPVTHTGYGAALRDLPDIDSEKVGSVAGNDTMMVNGWVYDSGSVDPNNPPELENGVWFRLSKRVGGKVVWVSYRGVRAEPTEQDPSGISNQLGPLAPTPDACELSPEDIGVGVFLDE